HAERHDLHRGARLDEGDCGTRRPPVQRVEEGEREILRAHAALRCSAPMRRSTASAAASEDIGFWLVMRLRSTTTCDVQGKGASSNTAPAFFSAVSRYQAMPFLPTRVWSSSSSVKDVIL